MEAEVFLLGHWKDYNELEESLSMPELLATLKAARSVKWRDYKFNAAMQGVTLPEDGDEGSRSFEEVKRRAETAAAGGDPDVDDIVNLKGSLAQTEGFGIDIEGGMRYQVE